MKLNARQRACDNFSLELVSFSIPQTSLSLSRPPPPVEANDVRLLWQHLDVIMVHLTAGRPRNRWSR